MGLNSGFTAERCVTLDKFWTVRASLSSSHRENDGASPSVVMKVQAHKQCSVGMQEELPEGELLPFLLWISRNLKFQSHMESPIGSVLRHWGQGSGERGGCWLCLCQSRDLETGRL